MTIRRVKRSINKSAVHCTSTHHTPGKGHSYSPSSAYIRRWRRAARRWGGCGVPWQATTGDPAARPAYRQGSATCCHCCAGREEGRGEREGLVDVNNKKHAIFRCIGIPKGRLFTCCKLGHKSSEQDYEIYCSLSLNLSLT